MSALFTRGRISFEVFSTIVVVIIFCAAATFSAYSIIEENHELKKRYGADYSSYTALENAYSDFEVMALSFAVDGFNFAEARDKFKNELEYFQVIFQNFLAGSANDPKWSGYDFKSLRGRAGVEFQEMKALIQNSNALPDDELRRQIISRIRSMQITFLKSGLFEFIINNSNPEREQGHIWLFTSVVVMGISGLGLIALLLQKIKNLEGEYEEKKKIAGLLEPRMAAVESSRDGIGITSETGMIGFVNKALAGFHGYEDTKSLIGKSWQVLYSSGQREWFEAEVIPSLKKTGHWQGHCTGLRKDGTEFYQDLTVTLLGDGGWVWIVRDYSEMINAMATSNRRLAAIEAAGDGIGMVDRDGRLSYINRALMNLHGITPDKLAEYIGKSWLNMYSARGREDIHQNVLPALEREGHWKGEAPIARSDGKVVYAEMSLTLLPDGGLIGTARDISDRKKAEEEKEHLQNQFFQAQKMEAVGRLAGGIAHDFNNILASMLGYAEFLIEDLDTSTKQHHFARQIMHGGRQAQNLVEQILAFSRRKESARARLDMTETISDTAAMLQATLPQTITLDLQINVRNADIDANATQISQILMNLCVNARDAMSDDRGTLRIGVDLLNGNECKYLALLADAVPRINYTPQSRFVESKDESTVLLLGEVARNVPYVRVIVSDSGCGMSRQVMEHIFEPFFTTKDLDKGTGLGLSTVHGMMAGHQGALAVSSIVGKGTSFELYFPALISGHVSKGEAGLSADDSEDKERGAVLRRHILIVEDDATVCEMLVHMIRRIGYEVSFCTSGDEAIERLRKNIDMYDLVLSDHMMPNMTGVELAEAIKAEFPVLPVILLSGYSPKKLEDAMAVNPSIRAILKKPVSKGKLGKTLETVLNEIRKAA